MPEILFKWVVMPLMLISLLLCIQWAGLTYYAHMRSLAYMIEWACYAMVAAVAVSIVAVLLQARAPQ